MKKKMYHKIGQIKKNIVSRIKKDVRYCNTPITSKQPPVFAIGTGRCGTHFIARLMEEDHMIASFHTDTVGGMIGDSFLQYCLWNRLPIDLYGFLAKRQELTNSSTSLKKVYFEANPYLSLAIPILYDQFKAKFIFMIRNPRDTVKSHYNKGWYRVAPLKENLDLSLGYQYHHDAPNKFFGRIVPHRQEFSRWLSLTQIGKIAWMWNTINLEIKNKLNQIPQEQYMIVKLEQIDYNMYSSLHSFIGGLLPFSKKKFEKIKKVKPGKGKKRSYTWNKQEENEFISETQKARDFFKY
ncbi:hypothetical protein [Desulfonema magnum]|uniref:Sulfotransferase domain-containing protein n=1 Tax=Desulfonema magnum TaxID=45655 RepID=A0A975GQM9_9BACT|nr:hypothetical protein [Desulfonema magnum]QTA90027.1 Uncharacterized protein dnm_060870 [Desulfonema magnum]